MKTLPHSVPCRAILGAAFCALAALPARATLKYQPGDYAAQDALVVHLDGIANAGVGKPHDPTAAQWANLADPANPVAIVKRQADASAWTDSGYYFGGKAYGITANALESMTTLTIEAVGDWPAASQGSGTGSQTYYCMYVSANLVGKDFGVFTVNQGNQLQWKTDNFGVSSRPKASAWGGKNFSCALAADTARISFDGSQVVSSARSTQTALGAAKWVIANGGNEDKFLTGTDYTRQVVGTFNSVRIYNRALTTDEVAKNAAIDAARFKGVMPVTNAVVATSVAGANGNEIPGVYAVEGSHVFTAPASCTVSGTTYALTGCTVETWENGAWGAAVQCDGVFAVEVSESEKVKITWNWASTSATLNRYATDGLVVWLDGIWNAGKGVHSASATTWANLANPANNAAITANASSGWHNDGYYFCYASSKPSYAQLVSATPAMTQATFEFAVDAQAADQKSLNWGSTFISSNAQSDDQRICAISATEIRFKGDKWTGNSTRPSISGWSWKQASFTLAETGAGNFKAYDQGIPKTAGAAATSGTTSIPETRWMIGSRLNQNDEPRQFTGTMRSVRIYDRALSPAEVAQNAAADAARFEGTAATAVEVVADPRGFEGREPAGMYFPEGWTFSSGVSTKTVGSVEYAPAGYVVETYDSTLSSWVVSERVLRNGDGAVEWTAPAAPFSTYRLTWLWEPVSGIRRATDYTIADYAPGGMVVWYDGICNDGIGAAHVDSASHRWRELVTGEQANMTVNANSGWESDGYRLALGPENEKSYFYLNTANNKLKSLGTVGTMEIACDVKGSEQVGDWPCILSFGHTNVAWAAHDNDMSIHTYKTDGSCRWKTDTWSGGGDRANITQPWDGKHAAFVMDTATFRSYRRGTVDQTRNRVTVKSMPPAFFFVGNKFYQNGKDNNNAYPQLTGTMKAVRAYNRVLSDAEIAHNYKVDVARFDGALVTTNVVVATSDYNGALAADAYEVYGTHVFEGAASAVDGSMPNRVKVWTLENSAWTNPQFVEGSSYTYTAGTSPATVKIEFGKTNPFVLIVR